VKAGGRAAAAAADVRAAAAAAALQRLEGELRDYKARPRFGGRARARVVTWRGCQRSPCHASGEEAARAAASSEAADEALEAALKRAEAPAWSGRGLERQRKAWAPEPAQRRLSALQRLPAPPALRRGASCSPHAGAPALPPAPHLWPRCSQPPAPSLHSRDMASAGGLPSDDLAAPCSDHAQGRALVVLHAAIPSGWLQS